MMDVHGIARELKLEVSHDAATRMVVLSGARGTVVFNPRLRGILVGDEVLFRGHRVIVRGNRVSVPAGFLAACREHLGAVEPTPALPVRPAPKFHVVVDAGHGGHDPGAVGANGAYEKTVNLLTAKRIASKLEAHGIRVTLTRSGDVFVPLNERAAIGNRFHADAFVSIHADAAESRDARGFTLLVVHTKYSDSSRAALVAGEYDLPGTAGREETVRALMTRNRLHNRRLASRIRQEMDRVTDSPDRGTQLGALRVLRRSVCPAVLVELGFLSNPAENARLVRSDYQERLASAVAAGIIRFLEGA